MANPLSFLQFNIRHLSLNIRRYAPKANSLIFLVFPIFSEPITHHFPLSPSVKILTGIPPFFGLDAE